MPAKCADGNRFRLHSLLHWNNANGDAEPIRKLNVTHRAYAMAVDEENEEFYLSLQYPPQVAIYRKQASGNEKPRRLIQGESTRLSDSHGIAIDPKSKLLFVNNWGNISDYRIPGSGRFEASFDHRLPPRRRRRCAAN